MKVLFAQNLFHVPSYGGASKSSRLLAEQLAARGHECHVVAPLTGLLRGSSPEELAAGLTERGATGCGRDDTAMVYDLAGVHGHAVFSASRLVRRVRSVAADLGPDWLVVPSDDPGSMMLAACLAAVPDRVVSIAYTIQQLPCGPAAFQPSAAATRMLRRTAGVVAISRASQEYLRQWAGIEAELLHPPVYGPVPVPRPGPSVDGPVLMVNPCGYKGLPIFLGLARAFPAVPFRAVLGWGTTPADRAALGDLPNVGVVDPIDALDALYRDVRIQLVPSLWDETFGFTCVDAMLRGVPVLASDVTGLVEAKLGVPCVLPVRRIERYDPDRDRARPVPEIPDQDLGPWRATLRRLLDDPAGLADLAARSRAAAEAFVRSLDEGAFERYLLGLADRDRPPAAGVAAGSVRSAGSAGSAGSVGAVGSVGSVGSGTPGRQRR